MEATKGIRFRQTAMGAVPLVAGLLLIVGMATSPWEGAVDDQMTAYYTQLAAHPGRAQLSTILIGLAFLLLVPTFFAMVQVTRHRGTRLGNAGWLLGSIGFGIMGGFAIVIDIYDMVLVQELGVEQAVAISHQLEELVSVALVGMAGGLGSLAGLVLMAAGLWRSREVPAWSPALLVVAMVTLTVSPPALVPMTGAACLLLGGLVPVSLRILRADDWETGGPMLPAAVGAPPAAETAGAAGLTPA